MNGGSLTRSRCISWYVLWRRSVSKAKTLFTIIQNLVSISYLDLPVTSADNFTALRNDPHNSLHFRVYDINDRRLFSTTNWYCSNSGLLADSSSCVSVLWMSLVFTCCLLIDHLTSYWRAFCRRQENYMTASSFKWKFGLCSYNNSLCITKLTLGTNARPNFSPCFSLGTLWIKAPMEKGLLFWLQRTFCRNL